MGNINKKHLDNKVQSVILLFFALIIMLIGFIVIQLIFIHFLGISNEYFISGYWIFAVIPVLIYFHYLQKQGKIYFNNIGLKSDNLKKNIFIGVLCGVIAGIIGWIVLFFIGSPVSPISREFLILFIFASVLSAPIREEILVRGIIWKFLDDSFEIFLKSKFKSYIKMRKDIVLITCVSLIFLFLHIGRDFNILFTTILIDSFIYSIIYYKTKNLVAPIIAHSISNSFIILRLYIF